LQKMYTAFMSFKESPLYKILFVISVLAASLTVLIGLVKIGKWIFGSKGTSLYYARVNEDLVPVAEIKKTGKAKYSYVLLATDYWKGRDHSTEILEHLQKSGIDNITEISMTGVKPQSDPALKAEVKRKRKAAYKNIAVSTTRATPAALTRAQLDQFTSITQKFERASARITTTIGSVHALFVRSRYVIFPAHVFVNPSPSEIVDSQNRRFIMRPLLLDRRYDLGLGIVDDKSCPEYTDLVPNFKRGGDTISDFGTVLHVDGNTSRYYSGVMTTTPNCLSENIQTVEGPITMLSSGSRRMRLDVTMTGVCVKTMPGWCGKPYFDSATPGERICAALHHTGGAENTMTGIGVTQEQIRDYLQRVGNSVQGQLVHVAEVDEVVGNGMLTIDSPNYNLPPLHINSRTREWIMKNVNDGTSSHRFSDVLDSTGTHYYGHTPKSSRTWRLKPDHVRTPWANDIISDPEFASVPDLKAPVIVDPLLLPDTSKLVSNNDGSAKSIIFTQAVKSNDPVPTTSAQILPYINRAKKILISLYKNRFYPDMQYRELTHLEVINGLTINPRNNYYKCLDPMNLDSSPGWDFRTFFNVMKTDELFEETPMKSPDGAYLYDFTSDPKYAEAIDYFRGEVTRIISCWSNGEHATNIVEGTLKVETRPREKVAQGSVRMFEQYSKAIYYVFRKYLGMIMACIRANRNAGYAQIGNSVEEATAMYRRLSRVGTNAEAGDYEAWDKHVRQEFVDAYMDVLFELTGRPPGEEGQPSLQTLFQTMGRDIFNIPVLADGHIYVTSRGHASGCPITSILNCGTNELLNIACMLKISDDHNQFIATTPAQQVVEHYLFEAANAGYTKPISTGAMHRNMVVDADWVTRNVDMVIQGDDIVKAVSTDYEFVLNFPTFKKYIYWFMGVNYTPPTKDTKSNYLVPLSEVWFLSRKWRYDQVHQVIFPVLKDASAFHLLYWTTALTREQYLANLRCVVDEAVLHSRERYELICKLIRKHILPYWRKTYGQPCPFVFPEYGQSVANYVNTARTSVPGRRQNTYAYREFSLTEYFAAEVDVDPNTGIIIFR